MTALHRYGMQCAIIALRVVEHVSSQMVARASSLAFNDNSAKERNSVPHRVTVFGLTVGSAGVHNGRAILCRSVRSCAAVCGIVCGTEAVG